MMMHDDRPGAAFCATPHRTTRTSIPNGVGGGGGAAQKVAQSVPLATWQVGSGAGG